MNKITTTHKSIKERLSPPVWHAILETLDQRQFLDWLSLLTLEPTIFFFYNKQLSITKYLLDKWITS